jgi:peroxiredoxin Q/BCP
MPAPAPELSVGGKAPDFTLKDQEGTEVTLSDFKGKKNVVLVFYPGDMTPGCTMQLCAIRDDWSKFIRTDTVVFGINHGDAESHEAFIKKHAFPFPLLIDKDKKVSARYGATKKFFKAVVIKRTVVVVGKDGTILFLKRGMPKDADILKAISS